MISPPFLHTTSGWGGGGVDLNLAYLLLYSGNATKLRGSCRLSSDFVASIKRTFYV